MNKSQTIASIAPALAKAQAEMPVVKMNATNPFLKNKYADLGAVIEASRPILAKHGLAIIQTPVSEGDKIGVTTMLTHESGEWLEDTIFINSTNSKGLSDAQNAGVVISYLRRYSWSSFLGLYADEDNDGHQPKPQGKAAQPTGQVTQPKSDERTEAVKAFSTSFNVIPANRKGEAQTISGNSTIDEIKKATAHNIQIMKEGK